MDHIKLTREVLSTGEVADAVTDPSCGAVSLFVGTTRNHFQVVKSLGWKSTNETEYFHAMKCSELI